MRLTAWKGMEVPHLNGRRMWTVREYPALMVARQKDGWSVFASPQSDDPAAGQVIRLGLDRQRFPTRKELLQNLALAISLGGDDQSR